MGFLENIRLAFSALFSNKMRALLTMLGIIIGISAVITITTIGNSIQKTLSNTFNQIGMNVFSVYMMNKPEVYMGEEDLGEEAYTLDDDDMITAEMLDELFEKYPDTYKLAMSEHFSSAQLINSEDKYVNVSVQGATEGFLEYGKIDILQGRNITTKDDKKQKNTAVVSDIFVGQYFKNGENPIGETVSITLETGESYDFAIIGIYEYEESKLGKFEPGTKEEDKVTPFYIPYNTVSKLIGTGSQSGYYYVNLTYNTDMDVTEIETNLRNFFTEKYENNPYWEPYIENLQTSMGMINTVINVITIAISVIAAISLIVGGVGVMNIMLVSITERTKEIGVRKALGAQNGSIRMQFVIEAIIICLVGGIIGIISGIINGVIIGKVAEYLVTSLAADYADIIQMSVSPSLSAIAVAVIFSMLIGVFFGYYPANKAAKMNPIDALRYE